MRHVFKYSGGSHYNEFLFRWKLASLLHDTGAPISYAGNDTNKIETYLNRISRGFRERIHNIYKLINYNDLNLVDKLDANLTELSLYEYMKYQYTKPFPKETYYDHGIISSLIFLRSLYELYSAHLGGKESFLEYGRLWHWDIFYTSILQSGISIALHNIDYYEEAYNKALRSTHSKVIDLEKRPLSWLLKVSDILHEWDKPQIVKADSPVLPTNIQIDVSDEYIVIKNLANKKVNELINKINKFIHPKDIIKFI